MIYYFDFFSQSLKNVKTVLSLQRMEATKQPGFGPWAVDCQPLVYM